MRATRDSNTDHSADAGEGRFQLRRVQLDLPPKAFERLVKLKVDTESGTYAEVIKNALRLYAAAIELQDQGNEFMLKQPDGAVVPILLFKS